MTYFVHDHDGGQALFERGSDQVSNILASKCAGEWLLCPNDHPRWMIDDNMTTDITEEEAAMILFQCGEPA